MHRRTPAGDAISLLILEIFRLNGRLLGAGDRLVAGLGLTSARWQVLGAAALAPTPEPVARLARQMGLNRQGVQRIANELAEEGFLVFTDNPHHRRAKLVVLTQKGREAMAAADRLQAPWVDGLGEGLDASAIALVGQVLATLRRRLEEGAQQDDD